jgi:hypothetical protein
MNELVSRVVGKPWPKGVSGNPSGLPGRPAGSRQTFSAGFLDDLAKTWRDKGRQTMEWKAENQPSTFFAVCARLIGPEVKLTIERQLPGNLSMEDWQVMKEIIAAIRHAVPDAASAPPGAVLEHVLGALRATQAKPIELLEERLLFGQSNYRGYLNTGISPASW